MLAFEIEYADLGRFSGSILDPTGARISPYNLSVQTMGISAKFMLPVDTILRLVTKPDIETNVDIFYRFGVARVTSDDSPYSQFLNKKENTFVFGIGIGIGVDYRYSKSFIIQLEGTTYFLGLHIKDDDRPEFVAASTPASVSASGINLIYSF